MSFFSSISDAVTKIGEQTGISKIGDTAQNLKDKAGLGNILNTKNLAYALPVTALVTSKGREELANSPWGAIGQRVASIYTGGASDQLINQYGDTFLSQLDLPQTGGNVAQPQGGAGGESGGAGYYSSGFRPTGNTPAWLIPAAIGVGVLVLALVMRK
jgi:hypothetical protein